jgi:hypothetical protein
VLHTIQQRGEAQCSTAQRSTGKSWKEFHASKGREQALKAPVVAVVINTKTEPSTTPD